jgi:hypothetical protein
MNKISEIVLGHSHRSVYFGIYAYFAKIRSHRIIYFVLFFENTEHRNDVSVS